MLSTQWCEVHAENRWLRVHQLSGRRLVREWVRMLQTSWSGVPRKTHASKPHHANNAFLLCGVVTFIEVRQTYVRTDDHVEEFRVFRTTAIHAELASISSDAASASYHHRVFVAAARPTLKHPFVRGLCMPLDDDLIPDAACM